VTTNTHHKAVYAAISNQADVLDIERLHASTLGEASLREEVLVLFFKQVEGVIRLLKTADATQDWAITAHTLRGAALAVGAREFVSIASDWEEGLETVSDDGLADRLVRARARLALALEVTGPVKH
jgi:HPt (histidine-containing phosphotransfer) domain-containing protein